MSMEWFNRVTGELQDHLESICEEYDQVGHMNINRGSKHPRIEFFVGTEEDRDYFCTLLFDPYNEEFYVESFDVTLHQPTRIVLNDITDVIDAVHEMFHEFMDDDSEMYYVDENSNEYEVLDEEVTFEEINVEWETPEVTAFYIEDKVEVTYQFGIDSANGDGVLRRVNRLWVDDTELFEDESTFSFKKEEANAIISMIASHVDNMIGYEEIINA
ncbi:hypothetical protein PB01_01635 [Psychrobacillus glaciei]|uniref:Uncharacterized protein n=1 Tax=Psychrobacillus glaciei TaxID=2283160 RepID=A0A5J6SIF3_9BACI|nr:hypothetical protein [Psychrobacillus glaciei]QFF97611.1 hypothetical protein PB01_01635 [Psychrobacillus glaciei]